MARTNAQATATPRRRAPPNKSRTPTNSRAAAAQKQTQSRQTGAGRSQASASKTKKNLTNEKDVTTEEESAGLNGTASPGPYGGSGFGSFGYDDDRNDEQPSGIDYNQRQDTNSTNSLAVSRRDADEPPVDWQLIAEDHQNESNRLKQQKLDIERQLRRTQEDSEAAHQALTELQSEVLDLKESLKSLKRKNQEAEDEQEVPRKKQNKKKAAIPHDKYAHADRAGKKFMANYCAFAHKVDIFDGFQQADRDAQEWGNENDLNDEENSVNADNDDDNSEGEERRVAGTAVEKRGKYDLTKTEERERFARDSAIRFFNEVPPREVEGWEDAEYQTRFMDGMSRMRSAFRDHEDARLVFGLPIDQENFPRASRKLIPAVAELLRNSTFLGEGSPESSRIDNAYRHKCLLQICRSILYGKRALVDGTKSAMARDIYAYQWRIKTMNINMIAFVAYISFFILSGEGNLAHASKTSNVYWRHLGFLYNASIKEEPTFINDLLDFYDKALRLYEDEDEDEEDPEQAALLREIEG